MKLWNILEKIFLVCGYYRSLVNVVFYYSQCQIITFFKNYLTLLMELLRIISKTARSNKTIMFWFNPKDPESAYRICWRQEHNISTWTYHLGGNTHNITHNTVLRTLPKKVNTALSPGTCDPWDLPNGHAHQVCMGLCLDDSNYHCKQGVVTNCRGQSTCFLTINNHVMVVALLNKRFIFRFFRDPAPFFYYLTA